MKNKGFTLIELLAVIVILAIIALIAVPIVLNIIKDSKESATIRSVELYVDAVNTSVANKLMFDPMFFDEVQECSILGSAVNGHNKGSLDCHNGKYIDVDVSGDIPISGRIKFLNGKVNPTGTSLVMTDGNTYGYRNGKFQKTPESSNNGGSSVSEGPAMQISHNGGNFTDLTSIGSVYYGDIVSIEKGEGTEQFYVIGSKSASATKIASASEINGANTTVTSGHTKLILLAMYNLNTAGTVQQYSTVINQSVVFSSTNYWSSEASYPVDLNNYTIPNNVTSIITTAKTYGATLGGTGRLMTVSEVESLGGSISNNSTSSCPSFINSVNSHSLNYWLGSAVFTDMMWIVDGYDEQLFFSDYDFSGFGLRPVVEISIP